MTHFNFVFPDPKLDRLSPLDEGQLLQLPWSEFNFSRSNWVLQTYIATKKHFPDSSLSAHLKPHAINISMSYDLPRIRPLCRPFVISIRADSPGRWWASLEVVQNKSQVGPNSTWMPHYPQPGLIPRDPSRNDTFKTVGYFGPPINHYHRFTRAPAGMTRIRSAVREVCTELGLIFVERADATNDYSDVDAAIGLRSLSEAKYSTKPPSKLVNAWIAGVPFVGGYDSAFSDIGEPDWNYLRVSTLASFKASLRQLRDCPQIRRQLVQAGCCACEPYRHQEVAARWVALLQRCADRLHLQSLQRPTARVPAPYDHA